MTDTKAVAEQIAIGMEYCARVGSQYYRKGQIVKVTYVGRGKITVMAPKAQVSMLPADFINSFEHVEQKK